METLIGKVREKWANKNYDPRINTDPNLIEFNKKMGDFFGLYRFCLNVIPGSIYNAYTMPVDVAIDVWNTPNKVIADKKTFKFKKEAGISIYSCIYMGLLTSTKFTNGEIMGILLHEIGHNFSSSIDNGIMTIKVTQKLLLLYCALLGYFGTLPILTPMALKNVWYDVKAFLAKNCPWLISIAGVISSIRAILRDVIYNVSGIADFFTGGLLNIPLGILNILKKNLLSLCFLPMEYRDEKIADAFATAYGYGPEIHSALYKMEYNKAGVMTTEFLSKIPVLGPLQSVLAMPGQYLIQMLDAHPEGIERLNSSIRVLKEELRYYNVDPAMKKLIEKDLAELEKAQKKFVDTSNSMKNPMLGRTLLWSWMLGLTDGDIKHVIFDGDFVGNMDRKFKNSRIDK